MGLHDLGIINRGAGADNIRNVTGSPTAGIDPQELIDTRAALPRQMHHYILNHREMYGLPRKFNIAFDGGGAISALEDTNDIGFTAVRVGEGDGRDGNSSSRASTSACRSAASPATRTSPATPASCSRPTSASPSPPRSSASFIEHGDRTDRKKARLKYVLDRWGFDKFLAEVEKQSRPARSAACRSSSASRAPPVDKLGHVGVHPQKQPGLFYVGVVLPVGRMTVRADARPRRHRRPLRQRHDPPDRLAEPADLRHPRRARSTT